MPRRGGKRKKSRTHVVENENAQSALASADALKVPRSLVIRRGKVESEVHDLVTDIRRLMSPFTALHFKEDAKNRKQTLSRYAKELTTPMGVTHILALSQATSPDDNVARLNMKLARTPSGPTMCFRVHQFSLSKQVRAIQRRPYNPSDRATFAHPPVVVTNNFGDSSSAPHIKLMRITFQNMFPAINVATVRLADCRRVVLFNLVRNNETGDEGNIAEEVEVRHYAVKATPVGINRKIRRLVQTKIPNLGRLDDISDYITGETVAGEPAPAAVSGNVSDSEPEDETSHVVLPQKYAGRGNAKAQKSALKLVELGPRLRLHLTKVERGLDGGDIMYHAHVHKTPEEVKAMKERIQKDVNLKQSRKDQQQANVDRKRKAKDEKLDRKKQRRKEREITAMDSLREASTNNRGAPPINDQDDESDDSADDNENHSRSSGTEEESHNDSEEEEEGSSSDDE